MKKTAAQTLKALKQLTEMDDNAFAEEFLTELTPEELKIFQKECPDFPAGHLPKNAL